MTTPETGADPGGPAEFVDPALADMVAVMPFAAHLGITLLKAAPDTVTGTLSWRPELCTVGNTLHGGVLMSLADSVGAVCAFLNLPAGAGTSTIESKSNLFRAVGSGTVLATSRPLHVGRSLIVVQTDITDDRAKLVAQTTQTQIVLTSGA
jgi:1,4-dihydroxy-2-naphthoyl-CoA hydrolase